MLVRGRKTCNGKRKKKTRNHNYSLRTICLPIFGMYATQIDKDYTFIDKFKKIPTKKSQLALLIIGGNFFQNLLMKVRYLLI